MIRFPKWCGKCQTWDHYAKDCTRVPGLGMSQHERDFQMAMRLGNCAIFTVLVFVVLAFSGFALMGA